MTDQLPSLWDLTTELSRIMYLLEESGGEITEEIEKALDDLESDWDTKVDRLAAVYRRLGVEMDGIREEEKRLKARRESWERNRQAIREYLATQMKRLDKRSVKTPLTTVSFGKSKKVVVLPFFDPGEDYWIEQDPKLDKKAIKAALEQGLKLPGAYLEESEHITIR